MKKRKFLLAILNELGGSLLPIIFWAAVMFGFDEPYVAILTIISALIHELGHLAVMLCLSGAIEMPRGRMLGFKIKKRGIDSYKNEILILLGGPMANIALGLVVMSLSLGKSEYLILFAIINIICGVSNLLPLESYDGFNVLLWMLESREKYACIRLLYSFSFLISVLLTFGSLYLVYVFNTGYWLFLAFFVSMMNNINPKRASKVCEDDLRELTSI